MKSKIKYPELIALVMLNISVIISWMAYNEYHPVIIQKFGLDSMANSLKLFKAIILVLIPVVAGFLTDYILSKNKSYFLIYTVGIVAAGMTFMSIASSVMFNQSGFIQFILPALIVIWLVAMNLFVSPANSLVDLFAPKGKLPLVMAILFITTELTYAFEPFIVNFINYIGASFTFIVGGILVVGSGVFFIKQTKDEIVERKEVSAIRQKSIGTSMVFVIGLFLGLTHSFIYTVIPDNINNLENFSNISDKFIATFLFIIAAFFALPVSSYWSKREILIKSIYVPIALAGISGITLYFLGSPLITFFNTILMLYAYVTLSIIGLPYIISRLNGKRITLGVGIYLGATQIFNSLFDMLR